MPFFVKQNIIQITNKYIMKIKFVCKETPEAILKYNIENQYKIEVGLVAKKIWLNPKQMQILTAKQKAILALMGRGSGKSETMKMGMYQRSKLLPRGSFFVTANTFRQLLGFSLKGFEETMGRFGLKKDRDYHFFKPPKPNWERPISAPEIWELCIPFRNGSYYQLMSADRADTRRGGSFDGGEMDEVGFHKSTLYEDVILPSLRGFTRHIFGNHYLYRQVRMFTSMPRTAVGKWIFKLIEDPYKLEMAEKGYAEDFGFIEGTAYDNIEVWGADGIERLKKSMTHLKFLVEVMNHRNVRVEKGFYPMFDPMLHVRQFEQEWGFDRESGHMEKQYRDIDIDAAIDASFDFGGWFTCATVSQYDPSQHVERFFSEHFRYGGDMLREVVHELCEKYEKMNHRRKFAYIYGEPRGWDPRTDAPPVYDNVVSYFREKGWDCLVVVQKGLSTAQHTYRYEKINEFFKGTNPMLPTVEVNADCERLAFVLQQTEIKPDGSKNKDGERDRELDQADQPHLGDTVDYKLMQRWVEGTPMTHRANSSGGS